MSANPLPHPDSEETKGSVTAAISEQIVRVYLDAFGRGPTRARAFVQPQFAVCVLRDVLTTAEHSLAESGGGREVEEGRLRINESIDSRYIGIVEGATGRPVLSHLARTRTPADIAVHFFLFDEGSNGSDL